MRRLAALVLPVALVVVAVCHEAARGRPEDERRARPGRALVAGDPDDLAGVRVVTAFENLRFRRPLWVGAPPDGTDRVFVLEQDGRVLWFENRADASSVHVALDMREKVRRRHDEEGLLGMAFHPDFATNRVVFLHYSASSPRRGVVSRFRMDAGGRRIRPATEEVVLQQRQPWGNHNGGCLAFGPDGMLYLSFGDGGAGGDPLDSGQDRGTWLGTMLRIDVDGRRPYSVPPDNPFVGHRGVRPEIWAYGLRNIWRFAFDPLTGTCWGGDVGQDAWEEIDVLVAGGNYGWKLREGPAAFRGGERRPSFIEPVVSHPSREARSITGGIVYRGGRLPGLVGAYVYGDYVTGWLWALRWDGERVTRHVRLGRGGAVTSFGEDSRGELLFTAFDGRIHGLEGGAAATVPFPRLLSETGLFTDMAGLKPHPALVAYDVNVPLWSDGAAKDRWILLPPGHEVSVASGGRLAFPRGTIFVKHFHVAGHRLETRVLVHRPAGWAGYTYIWDVDQREARLIDERVTARLPDDVAQKLGTPTWEFPGRGDCMSCHTAQAGFVLGFRPEQIRRAVDGGDQVARLRERGVLASALPEGEAWPAWRDTDADLDALVRSYLDANCAFCHRPDGTGHSRIDLRHDVPLERAHLVDEPPGEGDLGVRGARIVVPGHPERSLLWLRMRRTDEKGMPDLAHQVVDETATARVARWIRALRR